MSSSPEINPRAQSPHGCARTSTLTVTLPSGQRRTPSPKGGGRPLKTVTLASQSTRASVEFVESARKPVVPGRRRRQVGAVKFKSLLRGWLSRDYRRSRPLRSNVMKWNAARVQQHDLFMFALATGMIPLSEDYTDPLDTTGMDSSPEW